MLRSKRQRSSHHSHSGGEYGNGGSDDELMRMNPSLMTERQQLAFLLRKTAQDASASESAQSSDSSEDELIQSFAKGARRIQRNATGSPRRSGATNGSNSNSKSDGAVAHRGRGRPPKNAAKLPPQCQHHADGKTSRGASVENKASSTAKDSNSDRKKADREERGSSEDENSSRKKKLKVMTAEDLASATKCEKSSPSSSSDVLHMDTFESDGSSRASDFWSLHCALCCGKNASSLHGASLSEALFLCPSCDRKYPTQRALGRV